MGDFDVLFGARGVVSRERQGRGGEVEGKRGIIHPGRRIIDIRP